MEISDFFSDRQKSMLEALRPVMEERLSIDGQPVNVFRNVSSANLAQFVKTSKMKQVRGLADGSNLYFWDAYYATHQQIADALGVEYHVENRIHVWIDNNADVCVDFLDRQMGDYPNTSSMRRLLSSAELYFDGRSHGYVPGPEMLQLIAA